MSTKNLSSNEENLQQSFPICDTQFVNFKYIWTTKVLMRQLNDNESMIIHVSPKFATVHGQVAFQWSLQMRGTTFLNVRVSFFSFLFLLFTLSHLFTCN